MLRPILCLACALAASVLFGFGCVDGGLRPGTDGEAADSSWEPDVTDGSALPDGAGDAGEAADTGASVDAGPPDGAGDAGEAADTGASVDAEPPADAGVSADRPPAVDRARPADRPAPADRAPLPDRPRPDRPRPTDRPAQPDSVAPRSTPVVVVLSFNDVSTCIVGDSCTSSCIDIQRPDGTVVARFKDNDRFRALPPSDPKVQNYPNRVCLRLVLDSGEQDRVQRAATEFAAQVSRATGGTIQPQMRLWSYPGIELSMSKWDRNLQLAPADVRDWVLQVGDVDRYCDGVIVTHGTLDRTANIRLPLIYCGGAFGADRGVGGSGYSWIPVSGGHPFQCMEGRTIFHEWLHQVDWAYEHLMNVPDLYGNTFPACGHGNPDPLRWFPSSDMCEEDPDWNGCGQSRCPDLDAWNAHVLGAHFDRDRVLLNNHCRDERKDYGETGVDRGDDCR